MRISYSALGTYNTCPLKFKFQELDKLKTPKSVQAVFGTIVHSSLKRMFERTPLYPTSDELIDHFNTAWNERTLTEKEETLKAYYEEGVNMLKNFYKKNPPWNFNAVELESRFEVTIEGGANGENHVLAGIIDRVDKDPNSERYEIIDYKTSKRMPSQDALDVDLQLSIYNMALLKKWPHLKPENIDLSLYFLKHNEKITTKRSFAQLEKTKKEILQTINEIEDLITNNKEFICTPNALCDWCGFKKLCPMWKHLYRDESDGQDKDITESQIEECVKEYFTLKDSNTQNNKKLKEIQYLIYAFMEQEKVERVFGSNGYLTRSTQERTTPDMKKIKAILTEAGKWDELVTKKTFTTLKASKKKVVKV